MFKKHMIRGSNLFPWPVSEYLDVHLALRGKWNTDPAWETFLAITLLVNADEAKDGFI
jgi:hypothetical protein